MDFSCASVTTSDITMNAFGCISNHLGRMEIVITPGSRFRFHFTSESESFVDIEGSAGISNNRNEN